MALTFIRAIIIFITLVIVMRLMGKRQIGEMQPFEFVITLIIADLACVPMADVSIPLIYGIVGVLTLFIMHQLVSLLEQSSSFFRVAVSGKPSVVIDKNGVNMKELKKNNLGVDELIESMRSMGYFSLDDLDYAIFESNGKLSALESQNKKSDGLCFVLISCGKPDDKNIKLTGVNVSEITELIKRQGETLKSTEIMTVDGNGRVYFKAKNKKYKILSVNVGAKW